MNDSWIKQLARINKQTGTDPKGAIPVKNIMAAFKAAGMSDEEQAQILSGFMAATDIKPAGVTPAPAPTSLTLAQIVQMIQEPSKHANLVAQWNLLTPDQQAELKAQILALKPAAPAKAPDVDDQKLIQPVLNVMKTIQNIANNSTPKRTKMLDVIQELNQVLPTPALTMQDDKGETYATALISLLTKNADKFGTTATPGDKFVQLVSASIKQNKPIELPQTALEARIIELSKVLSTS